MFTHRHNRRNVPVHLVPVGLPALSSSSGRGKTHVCGRPECSAASCASLWTVGSGTRPGRARKHTNVQIFTRGSPPLTDARRSWWRHFDCASIFIVEKNGGGGWVSRAGVRVFSAAWAREQIWKQANKQGKKYTLWIILTALPHCAHTATCN